MLFGTIKKIYNLTKIRIINYKLNLYNVLRRNRTSILWLTAAHSTVELARHLIYSAGRGFEPLVQGTVVFKTTTINRSDTQPLFILILLLLIKIQ